MAKKRNRHEIIRRVIREKAIRTQADLVKELSRQNFKVTQATVSRDVNQLGLVKMPSDSGKSIYILAEDKHLRRMCEDLVNNAQRSGALVVVATTPGGAQSVASAIDLAKWDETLGTIAGDDTILVVARGEKEAKVIVERINKLTK